MTTGALTSLMFSWERYWTGSAWAGEYGTASSATGGDYDKVFGQGQKISSLERNNNLEVIYGLGQRGGVSNQEKQFAGSISIEASLANPYIFRAVLGNGGTVEAKTVTTPGDTVVTTANVIGARTLLVNAPTANFEADQWVRIQDADTYNTEYLQIESLITDTSLTFNSPLMYVHPTGDTVEEWDALTGTGPYIHVFTEMNTAPSITIQNSFDLSSDQKLLYRGCVNTGTTITCAVNEVVGLKMDYDYANETLSQTTYVPQTAETEEIYSFAHGALKKYVSNAWTTLAVVQNCEISINPNAEVLYGLGSRTGVERVGKQFEYDISASMMFQDVASLTELMYTGAASSTAPGNIAPIALELDIDNGLTGVSTKRACVIQLAGVKIDTNSLPQDPTAVIMEDVSMKATNMTVWGYNYVSAIP